MKMLATISVDPQIWNYFGKAVSILKNRGMAKSKSDSLEQLMVDFIKDTRRWALDHVSNNAEQELERDFMERLDNIEAY